jgi:hypothetical protein
VGLALFFGLILTSCGLVLTFFSFQSWYIDWLKQRLPMDRSRLIRGERISGFGLIFLGIFQTIKALV